MTVLEVIQRSADFLGRRGVDSPRLQVELLLAHVLGQPRLKLYLDFERVLAEPQLATLRELVRRRGQREPLQHILGATSFCGLELTVNRQVLIPRPETEALAERAWSFLRARPGPVTALDFGTGSGCLAIALAVKCPEAAIHAVDASPEALEVARQNARRHQVDQRIMFHRHRGLAGLALNARVDLIVTNPPYIPSADLDHLQAEVRDHDPRLALDGGADGLDCFRALAAEGGALLNASGRFMAEFGDDQEPALRTIFEAQNWVVEAVERDYGGRPRFLVARRDASSSAA